MNIRIYIENLYFTLIYNNCHIITMHLDDIQVTHINVYFILLHILDIY